MFHHIKDLYQYDWRIFMAATAVWMHGGNPYGRLSLEFGPPGAFAYPPTALTWLTLFVPFGVYSYYLWTALELGGWWLLIRHDRREQLILLCWSPLASHLVEGQSSLAVVLLLWAAYKASARGWLWGLALAWALTKPQVAVLPVLWLLWQDRQSAQRFGLWSGILLGTALLALPPTLMNPGIWGQWLHSLSTYRARTLTLPSWYGAGLPVALLAAWLWHRTRQGGWQWWLSAGAFPQGSFYATVSLLPMLRPRLNYWSLGGLALAGVLQGPMSTLTLPLILSLHLVAAWMLNMPASLSDQALRHRP